jgi:SAM-dependent methyltransferase
MSFTNSEIKASRGFVQFLLNQRKHVPSELIRSEALTTPDIGESGIRESWNEFGAGYIVAESVIANQLTFLLLHKHLRQVKPNERILSVGSGPGLFETYLAEVLHLHRIFCVDIANNLLKTQLEMHARKNGKAACLPTPLEGSMNKLPFADNSFSQLICINSLHWSQNWVGAVEEMDRVLSKDDGSQAIFVAGTANRIATNGKKIPIATGLNTDTLIETLESKGLALKGLGRLNIDQAQFNIPTARFYCVVERGQVPNMSWSDRIIEKRNIPFIDYHVVGEKITSENLLTRKVERVI